MASQCQDVTAKAGIETETLPNRAKTTLATSQSDDSMPPKPATAMDEPEMLPRSNIKLSDSIHEVGEEHVNKTSHGMDDRSKAPNDSDITQQGLMNIEEIGYISIDKRLKIIERRWDEELERVGRDAEHSNWSQIQEAKALSFLQDTTAFAFSREWVHGRESGFIQKMMAREEFEKKLLRRRMQWEAINGVPEATAEHPTTPEWPKGGHFPHFHLPSPLYEPWSAEARFDNTVEGQGYDTQERRLRSQLQDIIRQRHESFKSWNDRAEFISISEAQDARFRDVWPILGINYVPWKYFKGSNPERLYFSQERHRLFSVDVLDGEPDLSGPRMSYDVSRRILSNRSEGPADLPTLAHGLVPERIRLNGPDAAYKLIGIRKHLLPAPRPPTILLQPYRILAYHEKRIRHKYAALREKTEESNSKDEISRASLLQASGGLKPVSSDDGDILRMSSGRKGQSIQEGEMSASSRNKSSDTSDDESEEELPRKTAHDPETHSKSPSTNQKTALSYLGYLLGFMDKTVIARRNHVQGTGCQKVSFRDLWFLFNPGDEVVRRDGRQVYKVIGVVNPTHRASSKNILSFDDEDASRYFQVSCVFVDFDGKRIGPVSITFVIKAFAGERSVDSLEVYPLRFHKSADSRENFRLSALPNSQLLRCQLIERGKKFFQAACMRLENTYYDGPTADGDEVESQVVIDFETALSSGKNFDEGRAPKLESLLSDTSDSSTSSAGKKADMCSAACCGEEYVFDDSFVDKLRRDEYIDTLIPKTYARLPSVAIYPRALEDTTGENALTDDEFLLMTYRVFAFVLRTRKWGKLSFFSTFSFIPFASSPSRRVGLKILSSDRTTSTALNTVVRHLIIS